MNKKLTTKKMTAYALMTAVMCILCPMSLQIGIIPISLTNLVIYFSAYILGTRGAIWSYFIYFMLGVFGLPVFSGFSGGLSKLVGPTGGWIVGFFITAALSGIIIEKFPKNKIIQIIGIYLSIFVAHAIAVLWFAFLQKTTLWYAFTVCVVPFLAIDLAKVILSAFIGPVIASRVRINAD